MIFCICGNDFDLSEPPKTASNPFSVCITRCERGSDMRENHSDQLVERVKGIETFSGVLVAVSSKRLRLAFAVIGSDHTSQPVGCQIFNLKNFDQLKTKSPVSKCLKVAVNLFRFVVEVT